MRGGAGVALAALLLAACTEMAAGGRTGRDPQSAYFVARMAEGAYLASPHFSPTVLQRLAELDLAARLAVEQWRANPDAWSAHEATARVGALHQFLMADAQF